MHIEGEPVVAYCYINKKGDNKNICYLSKENLLIRYKSRLSTFENTSIQGITFEHKVLLFPIVAGGIITPLSIHALLHAYMNPWVLLSTMIIGLILMYYGWEGSSTMTIKTSIKDYDFFIRQPTANLKAFAEFVQHYISEDEKGRMFYFTMEKSVWLKAKEQAMLKINEPLILNNWREIKEQNPGSAMVILGIDPIARDVEIKFINLSGKGLKATVKQDIPIRYIKELSGHN